MFGCSTTSRFLTVVRHNLIEQLLCHTYLQNYNCEAISFYKSTVGDQTAVM